MNPVEQARELLAIEYEKEALDHSTKGYVNAAATQRARAAAIRQGKEALHAVHALVVALSSSQPEGDRIAAAERVSEAMAANATSEKLFMSGDNKGGWLELARVAIEVLLSPEPAK